MWPLNRDVISVRGLDFLASHTYKSGAYSVLDKVLNDSWWNVAVEWMPMWLAPNAITLIGTIIMVGSLALAFMQIEPCGSTGYDVVPAWVHLVTVLSLFAYQTLDAIDGKQARRTQNSSPLGQLFDHGCDALVTAICLSHTILALGLGRTWQAATLMIGALTVFFLGQLEESVTRVLRTNVGGMGVSEAQVALMALHAAAAILPCNFFHRELHVWVSLGQSSPLHVDMPLNLVFAYGTFGSMAFAAGGFLGNILLGPLGGLKNLPRLLPSLLLSLSAALHFSPLLAHVTRLPNTHPQLLLLTYAIAQIHLTTKMIVFSMAHEKFPSTQLTTFVVPVMLLLDLCEPTLAALLLPLAAAVVCTSYLSFAQSAIYQIASRLNIYAFRVNKPRQPALPPAAIGPAVASVLATEGGGSTGKVDFGGEVRHRAASVSVGRGRSQSGQQKERRASSPSPAKRSTSKTPASSHRKGRK